MDVGSPKAKDRAMVKETTRGVDPQLDNTKGVFILVTKSRDG
jgi:hypothetical protein